MDVGRQKLRKNCEFEVSRATLSHEMDVGRLDVERQKLGKITKKGVTLQPFRTKLTLDVKN